MNCKRSIFSSGLLAALFMAASVLATPMTALAVSGADVDFGGFIRLRHHFSNFATYNFGQVLPPDNDTPGSDDSVNFLEHRSRIYITPKVGEYLKGNVVFEIDGRWGDSAFLAGSPGGFGFGGDRQNLETKNLNFVVTMPDSGNSLIFGLQTIKDPYNGILFGWNDASGITYNRGGDGLNMVFGYYRLWQNTGKKGLDQEVDFLRAEFALAQSEDTTLGFNLHAILDNSGEDVGSTGVLGGPAVGSTSNGFAPLAYNASTGYESLVGGTNYTLNLWIPGVNFETKMGGASVGGFLIYEFGEFSSKTAGVKSVDISSFAGELHAAAELGGFNVKLSGMYVSGDDSDKYNGIGIKENGFYSTGSFGFAGAWLGLTGMEILFSSIDATHQDAALVYDSTNTFEQQPLGVIAVFLTANKNLADRVRMNFGLGFLQSAENRAVNGNNNMATEVNLGVNFDMMPGISFGIVGAYAAIGDFYEVSASEAATYNSKIPAGAGTVSALDPEDMWRVTWRGNLSF